MMVVSAVSVRMGIGGVCQSLVMTVFAKTESKKLLMMVVMNVSVRLGNGSAVIALARRTAWMVRQGRLNVRRVNA